MRLVVALGGNALLERGETPLAEIQEKHVQVAVDALAPLARDHDLVITHGNGPQVGLLALESATDPALPHPYPFDVLGAQTQGMIGYFLLQALENALPGQEVVSLICQTLVGSDDPAFDHPTKFVGPVYEREDGRAPRPAAGMAGPAGRRSRGAGWCASPEPQSHRRDAHHPHAGGQRGGGRLCRGWRDTGQPGRGRNAARRRGRRRQGSDRGHAGP